MDQRSLQRGLWILGMIVGGVGIVGALALVGLAFFLALTQETDLAVVLAGAGWVGLGLSCLLVWAGWSGQQNLPSPPIAASWGALIAAGLTGLALFCGLLAPGSFQLSLGFAPLHALAITSSALTCLLLVVAVAGRVPAAEDRSPQNVATLRQMVVAASGGIASIVAALPVELIGLVGSILVMVLLALVAPGGRSEVLRLRSYLEHSSVSLLDATAVSDLIGSPVVIGVLVLTLSVVTPIAEEIGKGVVVAVMGYWRRRTEPQVGLLLPMFVWGVAAGVGFAIIEGISNGALGLGERDGWALGVGTRALATGMHALTTGLVGLGWGLFYRRRWWGLPLGYACAMMFHGLWNLNVIVSIASGISVAETSAQMAFSPTQLLFVLAVVLQLALISLLPVGLIGLPLLLRHPRVRQWEGLLDAPVA